MSSTSTRAPYGMSFSGPAQTGGNDPPMIDIFRGNTGDVISDLSQYKTQGARCIFKFSGSLQNYTDSNKSFVMSMWTTVVSTAFARAPVQQWQNFVTDGTLLAHNVMDDFEPGSPVFNGHPPTMDDVDFLAQYSKSILTFLPCFARVHNTVLAAKSNWTYLDAGWMQWRESRGPVGAWYVNNINVGRQLGLGSVLGWNLLAGGSGATAPWNIHPYNHLFGMSPMEIDACTAAIQSAATYFIGMFGWSADPGFDSTDYYSRPDLQSSIQGLANAMIGRQMGPINWRGSSGTTSTGTTVTGLWSIRDNGAGTVTRKNNAASMSVPPPSVYATGDLHCLLCYSRDSGLTATTPGGWTETKRFISGNSAQGGELVLFHKVGSGASEVAQTVVYPGGGNVAGTSLLARWFVISHASTNAANLVAVAGSGRSWPSQTSMGPVPGATSLRSDALFLICAARANDFGGGSVDENWLSDTTGTSSEAWTRMFATGTDLGVDAGFFVDYAPTSGLASVATKAWSLTSGSQAGAGGGFMVAFAPLSVASGTPPELPGGFGDITISVGSNVSFTMTSLGSTPLTYSKISGPSNVTVGASTGAVQFTPLSVNTFIIVLGVTNAYGADSDTLRVFAVSTTASSNNTPVITHPGDKTVVEHGLLSFGIQATDPDDDVLSYSLEGTQAGMFLDTDTGQFIWVPSGSQAGTYPVVAVVTDGRAESRSTFTITVAPAPWEKTPPGLIRNSFRRI